MKYRLLDILACPIDKHFPLELIVLEEAKPREEKAQNKPVCEKYCGLHGKNVEEFDPTDLAKDCTQCLSKEIVKGVLRCPECGRWFPIIEEIPHMLPDELRDSKEDIAFLRENQDRLPDEIKLRGKPFNLA
ncbi:MAG: Trm112 family protein [Thermoproteota archaeon]|nr:MAG: Trm112 family protein [Candidatus Korarchaeota archaeon]RLG47429.1 MAG: Trm112 family protein [Candidatus Korarchaeota archaeon]